VSTIEIHHGMVYTGDKIGVQGEEHILLVEETRPSRAIDKSGWRLRSTPVEIEEGDGLQIARLSDANLLTRSGIDNS